MHPSTYIHSYKQELLQFEADRRAFIITINSFETELTKDDRRELFPTNGKLFPEGLDMLADCDDYEQVKACADFYPDYRICFEGADEQGMYACMYVCMYICMYICMYVYIYVCMYGFAIQNTLPTGFS